MANTEFPVGHPLAVSVWSKLLSKEAIRRTYLSKFIGEGKDAIVQELTDLKKSAGDNITWGLRVQLQGDGILGDNTLEGNEEGGQYYDQNIRIDQLRHAEKVKGKMTEQRVPYNLRADARDGLADWYARRFDVAFANHVCGNTVVTDPRYTGANTVTAPSTNRIIRPNARANDQSLVAGDEFTLDMLDRARVLAETSSVETNTGPLIRPVRMDGNDMYVALLHDYQVHDLRTSTASGQWMDIQKAAMQGGDVKGNPIFTGALGVYNGIVMHRWSRLTNGVHSTANTAETDTRRAVLLGAQAAAIAFGGESGGNRFAWKEKSFDYGNQLGVSAGAIWGLKKSKFAPESDSATNQEDFGTIVMSTYAVNPNA